MFVFAASVQCDHHYDWHTNTDDVPVSHPTENGVAPVRNWRVL